MFKAKGGKGVGEENDGANRFYRTIDIIMNHGAYLSEITGGGASETPSIHYIYLFFFFFFVLFLARLRERGKGVGSLKDLSCEQAIYDTLGSLSPSPFPSELSEAEMRDRRRRREGRKHTIRAMGISHRKADRVAPGGEIGRAHV